MRFRQTKSIIVTEYTYEYLRVYIDIVQFQQQVKLASQSVVRPLVAVNSVTEAEEADSVGTSVL